MYTDIYSSNIPDLLVQLVKTPEMQRLSDIGMHCGCEYANFPIYKQAKFQYTRLIHSIGVASIVWNFTKDITQAVAGMLHDIATPVFAHTIDFMNNDYMTQESTEDNTFSIIKNSEQIMSLIDEHGIPISDVSDYHIYPVADNDTPMLSADRLEYTLGNAYIMYNVDLNQIKEIYDDLFVTRNEFGSLELSFRSVNIAKEFTLISLRNSRLYVCNDDRFSMQYLSDIVRHSIKIGVITHDDLYSTESEVIGILKGHKKTATDWNKYTELSTVFASKEELKDHYCKKIIAKKRYIDPLVLMGDTAKRISKIDVKVKNDIEAFLRLDFNEEWLYAF